MAKDPSQSNRTPGNDPERRRSNGPSEDVAPWFDEGGARRAPAPKPVAVQPLSNASIGGASNPSWLLDLEGDSPAAPAAAAAEPSSLVAEPEATPVDVLPPTSYVEPETGTGLVTRALVPGVAALLLSFGAVGGYAFWKSSARRSASEVAEPLAVDPSLAVRERETELVPPPGFESQSTRLGTSRTGEVVVVTPRTAPTPAPRGVTAPEAPTLAPSTAPSTAQLTATRPAAEPVAVAGATDVAVVSVASTRGESELTTRGSEEPVNISPDAAAPSLDVELASEFGSDSGASPESSVSPLSGLSDGEALAAATDEPATPATAGPAEGEGAFALAGLPTEPPPPVWTRPRKAPSFLGQPTRGGSSGAGMVAVTEPSEPAAADAAEGTPAPDERDAFTAAANEQPSSDSVAEVPAPTPSIAALDAPFGAAVPTGPVVPDAVIAPSTLAGGLGDPELDALIASLLAGPAVPTEVAAAALEPTPEVESAASAGLTPTEVAVSSPSASETPLAPEPSASEPAVADALPSDEGAPDSTEPVTEVVPQLDWDDLVELSGVAVAVAEPSDVSPVEPIDNAVTTGEPIDNAATTGEPSDNTASSGEPSDVVAPSFELGATDPSPAPVLTGVTEGPVLPPTLGPKPTVSPLDVPSVGELAQFTDEAPVGPSPVPGVELGPVAADETTPTAPVVPPPALDADVTAELEGLLARVGEARGATRGTVPGTSLPAPVAAAPPVDVPVVQVGPIAAEESQKAPRSVLRRAEQEGSWPEVDVPNHVVQGPEFLLTPFTGNVRVVFQGGDVFEGRLHGVGSGKVSLDTKLGRMALDGRRLERIERLAPEGPAPKTPSKTGSDTSGLEEVRVTTKGGVFTGHLVSRDGLTVTLILKEGYRMTLEALEVTPVGNGRATTTLKRASEKPNPGQ